MDDVIEMADMNILEYEARVKRFAHPDNKGFINKFQLLEAFRGTKIFSYLSDATSMKTQFILSPFISDIKVGSKLKINKYGLDPNVMKKSSVDQFKQSYQYVNPKTKLKIYNSLYNDTVVDVFLNNIHDI